MGKEEEEEKEGTLFSYPIPNFRHITKLNVEHRETTVYLVFEQT